MVRRMSPFAVAVAVMIAGLAARAEPAAGASKTPDAASPARPPRGKRPPKPAGPAVDFPGFELLEGGGSRLFVQLTSRVAVEERRGPSSVTYVLKGATARVRNNTHALVTEHFNTPVARARLVPRGHDLEFVVELRAEAVPTWSVTEEPGKPAVLTVDFPAGSYLGGAVEGASEPPASTSPPSAAGAPRSP